MSKCSRLFTKFGGHKMAAGLPPVFPPGVLAFIYNSALQFVCSFSPYIHECKYSIGKGRGMDEMAVLKELLEGITYRCVKGNVDTGITELGPHGYACRRSRPLSCLSVPPYGLFSPKRTWSDRWWSSFLSFKGNVDTGITELVYDSRKIVKGCLFVCIKGANFDGHEFIKDFIFF